MRVRCVFSCTTSNIDSGTQGIRWHFARVRYAAQNSTPLGVTAEREEGESKIVQRGERME